MAFGRAQLEKFGWREGEGLGPQGAGIAKPIKAALKRDRLGLGADPAEEFVNCWWRKAYDEAASTVQVDEQNQSEQITVKVKTKKPKKLKQEPSAKVYKNFVQAAVLDDGKEVASKRVAASEEEEEEVPSSKVVHLSDEQLFKACGGRTAHKAARHGHKLSGKLARLQQQEQGFSAT